MVEILTNEMGQEMYLLLNSLYCLLLEVMIREKLNRPESNIEALTVINKNRKELI